MDGQGRAAFFEQEGPRNFEQECTLRIIQREEYCVDMELWDLGCTITAVRGLEIDSQLLPREPEGQSIAVAKHANGSCPVFSARCLWTPAASDLLPTPKGQRDVLVLDLEACARQTIARTHVATRIGTSCARGE